MLYLTLFFLLTKDIAKDAAPVWRQLVHLLRSWLGLNRPVSKQLTPRVSGLVPSTRHFSLTLCFFSLHSPGKSILNISSLLSLLTSWIYHLNLLLYFLKCIHSNFYKLNIVHCHLVLLVTATTWYWKKFS